MFSSINFLFLTSLAITSWVILCYFKQIEQQRDDQIHVDFNMNNVEGPFKANCQDNYDIYLNFLCIFACVYALAKVTQITENYIAKHMHERFGGNSKIPHSNFDDQPEPKTIEEYRLLRQNLLWKISYLENVNNQLEHRIKELQQYNLILMGKGLINMTNNSAEANNFAESNGKEPNSSSTDQNVFISNKHFHFTRQVYVSDVNSEMDFKETSPNSGSGGGDCSNIWQKYLEMQNYTLRKPFLRSQTATEGVHCTMPLIVSTAELQEMQGLS